ncbi:xanthine dehydrogenase family protein molybdopterin-binding subunit [Aneurinibacillus aneurinilyticus]|jgi:carbon-monoxide dehydrogenase large subunit|uniref:Putative carbon-monoxide dehydrogenase, large subunit n=1 Tax=Aneurinibacillus aneurinilyticus ATCC 12856 TaxID=649747 RepID=U1WS42_ANEAE|nr:molybdopterin cofactor-binding domain-containing protein [Aneurinibacillus aneurinilyticus]ERI11424.1 putative carbon-monoxide dehydrogenase, large subunit [Aneurinibacillus aneurinilyticus ATCC 12856]MCI1694248.1 molybdopterin-dependent oxidoreductase [Aneurinibacillus aneurinilyticus]MED0707782.1 molybdopterin-dependent oxidoreductase [Aneurinibacillus aneurinilyticus]MED0722447.1 molybdopterin-dependent oxidoreductase [Aneurinibacillus aneurinilyticus]MED0733145.1 molybdopterin-dependent
MASMIGMRVKRKEDPKLITGNGNFTDDIKLPGMLYAAFLRSTHAHARIKRIDVSQAVELPGVVAVYTGEDLTGKIKSVPTSWYVPGCNLKAKDRSPLAVDKVLYVGEGVAMVVAEDRYTAYDALNAIEVEYEELKAVTGQEAALKDGAPLVHEDVKNNLAFLWKAGDVPDEAFTNAEVVVRERYYEQRVVPNPMETRAAVAQYNSGSGDMTVWCTSQNPHIHRMVYAEVLGIPESKLRIIAPDVGGGFGAKIGVYADEAVVAYAARHLKRPVKWMEDRKEHFMATNHARDEVIEVELAGKRDGTMTALRVRNTANMGAYLSTMGAGVPTICFGLMVTGAYAIPQAAVEVYGVYTNTTPTDAYRGAGKPESAYQIERAVDAFAREIGMDPVEIRRKNFVPKEKFPYDTAMAVTYDSGDYMLTLDKALEIADYEELRREQEALRKQGRYLGIGLSTYVELCGLGPSKVAGAIGLQFGQWENATVRVHPSGKVTVLTGASPHGQGEDTTFAQVVADKFGVPLEDIEVLHGDTQMIPMGWGTYGSRTTPVGGAAVAIAAERVTEKAKKIAAHELEVSTEDLEFSDGIFQVKGVPGHQRTFQEIARSANMAWNLPEGMEPALEAQSFFDPSNFVYPFGAHICVVEVDSNTGQIELKRYIAVDDVGRVINPMIAEGQVHGGLAQGIGQALWEGAVYEENGQLISGTFMDYTMPKADFFPVLETAFTETPSPVNPLGAKGVGETGATASPPAVVNAVLDALRPFGITHLDMPLTPEKVWRAMQKGRKEA